MISGYFVDAAQFNPSSARLIAPDWYFASQVFAILDSSEYQLLSSDHPGAKVLLKWWKPKLPNTLKNSVSGIGRSTGLFHVPTGKHSYYLKLLTGDLSNKSATLKITMPPEETRTRFKGYLWTDTAAKKLMKKDLITSLSLLKKLLLALGLILMSVSFFWEFSKD